MSITGDDLRTGERTVFADLARKLHDARSLRETALATLAAADELFGFDACYVQLFHHAQARVESLYVADSVRGERAEIDGWNIPSDSSSTAGREFERPAQLLSSSVQSEWTARLLGSKRHRIRSAMAVPIGRILGRFAQLSIQSYQPDAYTPEDLDLFQALADFCSDSFYRNLAQTNPNHSPYALLEENRLLHTLIDTLPDYLYIKDRDGRFVIANSALVRSLGASTLEEVLGKTDRDFAPRELQEQYWADELQVMESGNPLVDRDELVMEASGARMRVLTTKVPLRDPKGQIIGLVGVGHGPRPDHQPKDFRRGTAEDTARRAGVSVATVSRAFNGSPKVTEKTRQRIFEAAREVGYAPHAAARSLSKGRSDTVAIVFRAAHMQGEFYSEALAGFQKVVRDRGLDVLLSVVPGNENPMGWLHQLISGSSCAAVAVHQDILEGADAEVLTSFPVPVIVANYHPADAGDPLSVLPAVGFDNRAGIRQTVRHLVALGHRDIAYLGGTPGSRDAVEREQGFREALAEHKLAVREEWIVACTFEPEPPSGIAGVQQILSALACRPTAIVCACDNIAGGAVVGARKWGQRVPEDLSITGFDDASWSALYSPPLTTVRHRGRDLGMALGHALLTQMSNPARAAESILIPTSLVVRESTAARKEVEVLA